MGMAQARDRINQAPLVVELTTDPAAIREAQALRYAIFSEEGGARLDSRVAGVDEYAFDIHWAQVVGKHPQQQRPGGGHYPCAGQRWSIPGRWLL